jgi:hypothetical protein
LKLIVARRFEAGDTSTPRFANAVRVAVETRRRFGTLNDPA